MGSYRFVPLPTFSFKGEGTSESVVVVLFNI